MDIDKLEDHVTALVRKVDQLTNSLELAAATDSTASTASPASRSDAPDENFQSVVSEILKRDHVGHVEALRRARQERPDLFKDYQDAVPERPNIAKRSEPPSKVVDFMSKCSEIMKRDRCERTAAMTTARREYPGLFEGLSEV